MEHGDDKYVYHYVCQVITNQVTLLLTSSAVNYIKLLQFMTSWTRYL